MNVSISQKEYDAINFAICQIEGAVEGADDEEYIKSANEALSALYSLIYKYKKARFMYKCREEDNAKIRKIMKEHPFETSGMTVVQVKRLIYRGSKNNR